MAKTRCVSNQNFHSNTVFPILLAANSVSCFIYLMPVKFLTLNVDDFFTFVPSFNLHITDSPESYIFAFLQYFFSFVRYKSYYCDYRP